jgi:hypothetical protein
VQTGDPSLNNTNNPLPTTPPLGGYTSGSFLKKGHGELSQSFSAIVTAIVILFSVDLLNILVLFLGNNKEQSFPNRFQWFSIVIDVILGIYILKGKKWARDWMLIRSILGIVVWGGLLLYRGEIPTLIMNTGVLVALILLLTGTSNRIRTVGSIVLTGATVIIPVVWIFIVPSINLPTLPETQIPSSYQTYANQGFFSISYPPDWETDTAILSQLQQNIEQYAQGKDIESEVNNAQVVFSGWQNINDSSNYAFTIVCTEPKPVWPLHTVVESTDEWNKENIGQYVEFSRSRTKIGGREAIISVYQGLDSDSVLSKYTMAYISGDQFIWTVVCGCMVEAYGNHLDTFDNIVRSLRAEY